MTRIRTAVVPAAGLGTRMRPATSAVPKELLPVGGRPAIDWILEEAAIAGIERVVIVSNRRKPAIFRYLQEISHDGRINRPRYWATVSSDFPSRQLEVAVVYQEEPRGLGDAVRCAQSAFPYESVAVMLPDEIFFGQPILLSSMLEHHDRTGQSMTSLMQVPAEDISRYGCADVDGSGPFRTLRVKGCIEKPNQGSAPSDYALCGRYVLSAELIESIDAVDSDSRGEVQLTPALDVAAKHGDLLGVEVVPEDGRIDVGSWSGWLSANRFAFELAECFGANTKSLYRGSLFGMPQMA